MVLFLSLLGGSWFVLRRFVGKSSAPTEVPPQVIDVGKASRETSKVVLDETRTASGKVIKALSGKLVERQDHELILEAEGERVRVLVDAEAKISRTVFSPQEGMVPQTTVIKFNDLRIGDRLDILVREGEDGSLRATQINVLVTNP